jgi:hypothetical protein
MVVSQKISGNSKFLEVLSFNCEGDTCIIKNSFPVMGAGSISGVSILGQCDSLLIEYRATVDSVNWTDWEILNIENLSTLSLKEKHPFQIEYRITSLSTTYNYLYKILLEFSPLKEDIPSSYETSPFNPFLTYLNRDSLLWATNVLEKFYKKSIVPSYLSRGDNKDWGDIDYLDFWWAPIYLLALKFSYDKIFTETLVRKDLLKDFLRQRGLISSSKEDLGELYYLVNFYFNELRRRGTSKVFEGNQLLPANYLNVSLDGELLRLLDCREDEVEKYFLLGSDIGWFIGESCPTYNSSTSSEVVVKGYEFTKDLENLSKYPIVNSQFVERQAVELNDGDSGFGFSIDPSSGNYAGLGFLNQDLEFTKNFSIPVNINFSYEITFLLKGGLGRTLEVGVNCFNIYGGELGPLNVMENLDSETNTFFSTEIKTTYGDKFKLIRCIIWSADYTEPFKSDPTVKRAVNLRFGKKSISSIIPRILVSGEGEPLYIYDLKVRPCVLNTSEFISQDNLLYLRGKNNNGNLSDSSVNKYINSNLIPYNMEFSFEDKEIKL